MIQELMSNPNPLARMVMACGCFWSEEAVKVLEAIDREPGFIGVNAK